jgi:hypothetical protein
VPGARPACAGRATQHPTCLEEVDMKRLGILVVLAFAIVGLASHPAMAKKMAGKRFLVSVPHTAEECMKAMDTYEASKSLAKWDFGCEDGDHTAYSIVTAENKDAALAMVPESMRANAKVVMITKFTAADLKKAHEAMMSEHK